MDEIISVLATAIATGAAVGLKDGTADVVRDAYATVRTFLGQRYPDVDLHSVEGKPSSRHRQQALAEDLADSGAGGDPDLQELVMALTAVLRRETPEASTLAEVDLEDVHTTSLDIDKVRGDAARIVGKRIHATQGVTIGEVDARSGTKRPNP